MITFSEIQRRHTNAESGYQACIKYHTERQNPDIIAQAPEYSIHCDRGWLIARVLKLEKELNHAPG